MTTENIVAIGKIVICLAILAAAAYIQVTQGHIPAPWDTLVLAVVAVLGLADGVRVVVQARNNRNRMHTRNGGNYRGSSNHH